MEPFEPDQESVELLKKIVEINEQVVKQNAVIIQALTLPALINGGSTDE